MYPPVKFLTFVEIEMYRNNAVTSAQKSRHVQASSGSLTSHEISLFECGMNERVA